MSRPMCGAGAACGALADGLLGAHNTVISGWKEGWSRLGLLLLLTRFFWLQIVPTVLTCKSVTRCYLPVGPDQKIRTTKGHKLTSNHLIGPALVDLVELVLVVVRHRVAGGSAGHFWPGGCRREAAARPVGGPVGRPTGGPRQLHLRTLLEHVFIDMQMRGR